MATYYVDPVNGNDANAGDSFAAGHPWKTIKKTFAAGDTVLVAKSPETGLAGTVTVTQGSVSVATTNDLTGTLAQYSIIRIDNTDTLYMVKAITSSVITLYRPYRGTGGSGKSATYFTSLPTSASNDWLPTAMIGTVASRITVQCGINTSDNSQDGFTILYGANNSYGVNGTWKFVDLSRVATLYWQYPWPYTPTDVNKTNCFCFRTTITFAGATWTRTNIYGFVSEVGSFGSGFDIFGCYVGQLETAEPSTVGLAPGVIKDTIFDSWRNAGYSGQYALRFWSHVVNTRFISPIFDELASGCPNLHVYGYGTGGAIISNVVFENPTLGSGTPVTIYDYGSFIGSFSMANVNGSSTDHRTYEGKQENAKVAALLSYDGTVYRTAAPSAKVTLYQSAFPVKFTHYIPCEAGVAKTVSVFLRKNSSYGSSTLPFMRLRWMTGTEGALVSNVHDVAMTDTNDTWVQCLYEVTPAVKGAIVMELIFQSANSGAIAYYDDVGLS